MVLPTVVMVRHPSFSQPFLLPPLFCRLPPAHAHSALAWQASVHSRTTTLLGALTSSSIRQCRVPSAGRALPQSLHTC